MKHAAALNQYRQVDVQTGVVDASPHKIISMLLGGLSDKLAIAKGAILRKDIATQGEQISRAIRIVDTLRASLDHNRGGDVAANLYSLYDYMERRLTEANMNADATIVSEVAVLVEEVASGWDSIPPAHR